MKKLMFVAVLLCAMPYNAFALDVVSSCMYECSKSECKKWSTVLDCCLNCDLTGTDIPDDECQSDSDCYGDSAPDGIWHSDGDGCEHRSAIKCVLSQTGGNKCVDASDYRCSAGYYGGCGELYFGCYPCPGGTSDAGNNAMITNCYATAFSDNTGSGIFTDKCYYSNDDLGEVVGPGEVVGGEIGEIVTP